MRICSAVSIHSESPAKVKGKPLKPPAHGTATVDLFLGLGKQGQRKFVAHALTVLTMCNLTLLLAARFLDVFIPGDRRRAQSMFRKAFSRLVGSRSSRRAPTNFLGVA